MLLQILCDKDPSVMSAALCALFDLVTADPKEYKNLTTIFVSILKQVAEHRLPKAYDYHRTPAPFVQVLSFPYTLSIGKRVDSEDFAIAADVQSISQLATIIQIGTGRASLHSCKGAGRASQGVC